jgi:hypothetical protein
MPTYSSVQSALNAPVYKPSGNDVAFVYGVVEASTALLKSDVLEFVRVGPCKVIDGFLRANDIDTHTTETLEIDVGTAADPDALLDSGVLNGDPITDHYPTYAAANGIYLHLNGLNDGPVAYTSETLIQGVATAAPAGGGTGTFYLGLYTIE